MMTRSRMFLMHLRKLICLEEVRHSNQSRPKPAVNDSHLSINEATDQDVG